MIDRNEDRRLCVVLPTPSASGSVDLLLEALFRAERTSGLDMEVVFVDDGSVNGTRERVRAWERTHPVKLLARDGERGLAQAVLAGARLASADVVVVMDADLSHPPERALVLAELVLGGAADMAIGSRHVTGGITSGRPWSRRIASRAASILAGPLTEVQDPLSGFFAVRKHLLLGAGRGASGSTIGLEVLARGGPDLRVTEVPIAFVDRQRGRSKYRPKAVRDYFFQLARLAGSAITRDSAPRFAVAGLLACLIDLASFHALLAAGLSLGVAHILSFAVATLANHRMSLRWTFARERADDASHRVAWHGHRAFLFTALLALFLRGGVLAFLAFTCALSPMLAIVPAILAGAAVNSVGCAFLVFHRARRITDPVTTWKLAAVGVGLYLLALRIAYAGSFHLVPEEAYYWNYSEHLDIGYLDHPPMVAWIIHACTTLLGQTELAVRAGAVACSIVTCAFVHLLARNLFGRAAGYMAVLLSAALPFFFGAGLIMTPDPPLTACWAGALYFLERAMLAERRGAWWGAGACLGLGMLSKYTIVLLALAALVQCLVDVRSRRSLRSLAPYGAALLAILIFSPVIVWNARNGWASFVFQGPRRWNHEVEFSLHVLVGAVLVLVTPVGLWAFVQGVRRADRARLFGWIFILVPLAVFVFSSLRSPPKPNWTGPLWLAALPFMASNLLATARAGRGVGFIAPARAWKLLLCSLLLAYGLFLHFTALGLPGVPDGLSLLNMNWSELGHRVERIEHELEERTGEYPLIVGMDRYDISSEIAFYDGDEDGAGETAGPSLFGHKALMYERWFPAELQAGKSLVLVSRDVGDLERPAVRDCVEDLEPVQELTFRRDGDVVGRFYARVAHGYDPQRRPGASESRERERHTGTR